MFIVIEGIDGAGGETQSKLLKNFLEGKNFNVELIKYPDYNQAIGKLIHDFLHEKFELDAETQFLLYATDIVKDKAKIKNALKEGKIVIADRYITSTLSYQIAKGFSLEKGLKFLEIFELPKPELIIFLNISATTSINRKIKEKKELDRHEKDEEFLQKVKKSYEKLIKDKILGEWIVIDGEKSIEEIAFEIQKVVEAKLLRMKK